MSAGEPPKGWSDLEIRRIVGASFMHPIVTEEVLTVCADSEVRVEHNQIHNVATGERQRAIRVMPLEDGRYMAVVVPVLADGRLLLVGRYRYSIDRWSTEFPRFGCQTGDTGWKHTVADDLWKNAGLKAAKTTLLGAIQADVALNATNTIVILAEGCVEHATRAINPRELITGTMAVSPDELSSLIRRGEVACSVTLAALYLYGARARR